VGVVTSQLQDDASRLHTFSGEPFRVLIVGVTALVTGMTLSFIYMWQFALLALACVPFMGAAMALRVKKVLGVDEVSDSGQSDELNHPSGIIVETLLNMRTVSALNLEMQRYEAFERALGQSSQVADHLRHVRWAAFSDGLGRAVQRWILGLEMWFGGYLMYTFPDDYEFHDFMVAIMAMLFALIGFGAALSAATNRDEAKESASRIFYLLDRKSAIDQLDLKTGLKLVCI
jgi:ATP-binding cassette, subfamily B (MDR/TAP), member 1